MAATHEQIIDFLLTNPSDAEVAKAMETYGVSPADIAKATGTSEGEIAARVAATLPPNQTVLLGDTYVQAVNQTIGSGEDQQVGGLQNVITYKANENKVGGGYSQYTPTGELEQKGTQQEVNATKDLMDFALTAGTLFGLPAGIGQSLGLSGAAGQAVGQGLLTTGTKLGSGENLGDALKAGLIGGGLVYGGSQLGDLINKSTYDSIAAADTAAGLTPKFGTTYDEFMANIMDSPEAQQALQDIVNGKTSVVNAVTPDIASDAVEITGARPTNVSIGDVFATTPTLTVTGAKTTPTTQQDVINAINTTIGGGVATTPEVKITADRPKITTVGDTLAAITTIPSTLTTTPVNTTTTTTDPTKKDTTLTTSDIIKLISVVPALAAINKVVTPDTSTTPQYPVVAPPESWATPPKTTVAPATQLAPIDFGNRNLLIGTQWEKFLDPNYGKVPEPVQYSQPSNLSYNDLMGILGSKQGMPSASSLSINDIISGIQNQYGQTASSTMG
jgi:hypothetical protein